MTYTLRFGDYTFPTTFYPALEPVDASVPVTRLPRAHGGRTSSRYLTEKVLRVEGGFIKETGVSLRTKLDALKAALQGENTLYFEADRFWRSVYLRDFEIAYEGTGYGRIARARLGFVTGDPFQYSAMLTTLPTNALSGSPASLSFTTSGNAPVLPKVEWTVGGAGAVSLATTVTNTTTGEAFSLVGSVNGGDAIAVDAQEQTVQIGGSDRTDLFEGLFPFFAVGVNTVQVVTTSGTLTNVGVSWRDRWY